MNPVAQRCLRECLDAAGCDFSIFSTRGAITHKNHQGGMSREPKLVLLREEVWYRMRAWRHNSVRLSWPEIAAVTNGAGNHGTIIDATRRYIKRTGAPSLDTQRKDSNAGRDPA